MPNISKGSGTRTEVLTNRWTKDERKQLEATYGNANRGIRAIVTAALKEQKNEGR
jgi:hypothetical protein